VGLLGAIRWRRFLTEAERDQIAAALAEAGRHTRARIGLAIEEGPSRDPQARAPALFHEWELPEGERATAVLVYVCAVTRRFALVGGEEVRRVAPPNFWELVDHDLHHHFDEGRYCDGIFKAIAQVALELERLFPRAAENETHERPATLDGRMEVVDPQMSEDELGGRPEGRR